MPPLAGLASTALSVRSYAAPDFTHSTSNAICPSASLSALCGIGESVWCRTDLISRLVSGFPATIARPDSPPLISVSRVDRSNPPLAFAGL